MKTCKDFDIELCHFCRYGSGGDYCWIVWIIQRMKSLKHNKNLIMNFIKEYNGQYSYVKVQLEKALLSFPEYESLYNAYKLLH